MPYYIVTMREVHTQGVEIEAESEEEAIERVTGGEGEYLPYLFEYSHTLDTDNWTIEEIENPISVPTVKLGLIKKVECHDKNGDQKPVNKGVQLSLFGGNTVE